ncbi:MAG TPA: hypothetical protein VLQ93_21460 [Myxococcaceae bacterium]|nr:hypothetical protein [Myxococcaceae bacterium]
MKLRPAVVVFLSSALLGLGCAAQTPARLPSPEPSPAVQRELGYREIVRLGEEYAVARGYEPARVEEAVEVRPNYWRVRFALAPRGSGKLLQLEFDEARRRVVKSTEVGGVAGKVVPEP